MLHQVDFLLGLLVPKVNCDDKEGDVYLPVQMS